MKLVKQRSVNSKSKEKCAPHHSRRKCDGVCNLTLISHCEHAKEITAEKHLLNLSYLTQGGGISHPDCTATYEIVIFNRSNNDLKHLSVVDSMMGLRPNIFGATGDFGGELRPYFTNVTATSCHNSIIPNTFEQIVAGNGELVACGSHVPARSVCTLLVRITGRGFLLPVPPGGTQQLADSDDEVRNVSMCVQNTAIIRGKMHVRSGCGCEDDVHIFPIYVKSGEKQTIQLTEVLPNSD